MGKFTWVRQGIVGRITDATRMLPFVRPDRSPGGPIKVEPPHQSRPPSQRVSEDQPEMKPQHHVHPSDDEARRQNKG